MTLVADLKLRFGRTRLPGRVYLPSPPGAAGQPAALVLWLAGRSNGDALCRELSAAAGVVMLEIGVCFDDGAYEVASLGWAAEHAHELGAHPGRLVIAGQLAAAARVARLAIDAQDCGWPVVHRQMLVRPVFSAAYPAPSGVVGAAAATIVTSGARRDDGTRYAATLREAGVEVQELITDPPRALPMGALARALR
jgi:acetyl esterase